MKRYNISYFLAFKWFFVYLIIFIGLLGILYALLYNSHIKNNTDENIIKEDVKDFNLLFTSQEENKILINRYNSIDNKISSVLDSEFQILDIMQDSNKIIVKKQRKLYVYDLSENNLEEIKIENLIDLDDEFEDIESVIVSADEDEILISVALYKKSDTSFNSPLSYRDYSFDLKNSKVSETNIFEKIIQSDLEYTRNENVELYDSVNNKIYYYPHSEGLSCSLPVKQYDIKNDKLTTQQVISTEENKYCPIFEKKLKYFALIPKTNSTEDPKVAIYSTENINSEISSYNINDKLSDLPKNWYPYSSTFINDTTVILGLEKNIYKIDFSSNQTSILGKSNITQVYNFITPSLDNKFIYCTVKNDDGIYKIIKQNLLSKEYESIIESNYLINPIKEFND